MNVFQKIAVCYLMLCVIGTLCCAMGILFMAAIDKIYRRKGENRA